VQHLHPEHVEVEMCHAEELAQRRGLTLALDAMGGDVAKQAEPRWLWHAMAPQRGTV